MKWPCTPHKGMISVLARLTKNLKLITDEMPISKADPAV